VSQIQVSRLLRPPVELYAGGMGFLASGTLIAAPSLFFMSPEIAFTSAGIIGIRSSFWWSDGLKVRRYQKNLLRPSRYSLGPTEIPINQSTHFLGKGFPFTVKHRQRIVELRLEDNEDYLKPSGLYELARKIENALGQGDSFLAKAIRKTLSADSVFNPVRPLPDIGGESFLHGVGADEEQDIMQPLNERHGHTGVFGSTRTGKSRLLECKITSDINRKGKTLVLIFDPKGDADVFMTSYIEAVRAGKEDQFYYFNLGDPDNSCSYSPVGEFQRITEVASRVTNPLPDAGNSSAFKAFSWRFVNVVAQARTKMGIRPTIDMITNDVQDMDTLVIEFAENQITQDFDDSDHAELHFRGLVDSVNDKDPRVARMGRSKRAVAAVDYLTKHHPKDAVAAMLCQTVTKDKSWYDKLVSSLIPFLEKLNTGDVGKLLSPDFENVTQDKPNLSWRDLIQTGGVAYLGFDAMTDKEVASAVGNAMFNDLVSVAGDLYKNGLDGYFPELKGREALQFPEIWLHADEFHALIGDEFIPMLNQAGGAGIRVTAYTQSVSDIASRLQDQSKAEQVLDNFNTIIMLRVQNAKTAEVISDRVPEVEVKDVIKDTDTKNSEKTGLLSFEAGSRDRIGLRQVPLVSKDDIFALPKGQAFVFRNGGKVYKVRFPLPKRDKLKVPRHVKDITARLRERYRTGEAWWEM